MCLTHQRLENGTYRLRNLAPHEDDAAETYEGWRQQSSRDKRLPVRERHHHDPGSAYQPEAETSEQARSHLDLLPPPEVRRLVRVSHFEEPGVAPHCGERHSSDRQPHKEDARGSTMASGEPHASHHGDRHSQTRYRLTKQGAHVDLRRPAGKCSARPER